MQVFNEMKVNKWQNSNFGVNYSFYFPIKVVYYAQIA